MKRKFNYTGACVPGKHYMVDITNRVEAITARIDEGEYVSLDRPRQSGKTTILDMLERNLSPEKYLVISLSFEGIGDAVFSSEERFAKKFLELMVREINLKDEETTAYLNQLSPRVSDLEELSRVITGITGNSGKKTVLTIDEVDKSSNNQLFLSFLGMLRHKYLQRNKGKDTTFQMVLLAGVHDVKNLKLRIRPGDERKYNSPWNIAADFDLDMCFSSPEIAGMLDDYKEENNVAFDTGVMAGKLHALTSGHPFLVSYLCRIIDDRLLPGKKKKEWGPEDLEAAVQIALAEDNTNFDGLIKNLENNPELYDLVFKIIMNEREFSFNSDNPVIDTGTVHGILKKGEGNKTRVHNPVYEQRIYNYMASKMEIAGDTDFNIVSSSYVREDGDLDIEKVIRKFQEFIEEQYGKKDKGFIERNGRLLFLAFIKPIINGKGFDFKEVQVSEEKRLDVVITYNCKKYIVELKVWRGEAYHREGIRQLSDYLDRQNQRVGYLLIYDLRKQRNQSGACEKLETNGKTIFAAWI